MNCEICLTETRSPMLGLQDRGEEIPDRLRIRPVFVCEGCDVGQFRYTIHASAMVRDGYQSWLLHLNAKTWFTPYCVDALLKFARMVGALPARRVVDGPFQIGARKISTADRARVMERDNFSCRRCGAGPEEARLEVDHVQPVTRGGGPETDNLQTLCHACNQGKRNRSPHAHDLVIR
jgi:hypothetical protein